MSSPASIGKHPIHPMLVVFPLGLLNFSCAADLIGKNGKNEKVWKEVAVRTMAGGVIGALGAAVPGLIDFLSLKGKAQKIGAAHMGLNLAIAGLFGYNLLRRLKNPEAPAPVGLSLAGVAGLLVSGWLGGELVYVHRAGVASEEEFRGKSKESSRPRSWNRSTPHLCSS